jgi:PhnB protein
MAKPVPDGYHTVTPYITVRGAAQAIELYKKAFGAVEKERMTGPDGTTVVHAEFTIGDSVVMISDEMPQMGISSPSTLKGASGYLFLYVPDVDAAFTRATEAGCKATMPPTDMFWGDRFAKLEDPFGQPWAMATHKEDVPPDEMARRAQAAMAAMGKPQG